MIPNDFYYSAEVFEREMSSLFGSRWQFVAMTSELENDRDFVCVDYHGTSVVVQNFKGSIRAFQNVCTHRFNRIQLEDRGNSPLTCRYHAWTFDKEGFPAGLPNRAQVLGDDVNIEDLCLTRYTVETCGKFLFVKLGQEDLSLRAFLGSFYQTLEELSPHIGAEVLFTTMKHKANWKLLVENVLDKHHCPIAHRDTFVTQGYCLKGVDDVVQDGLHSSHQVPRAPTQREGARNIFLSHLKNRSYKHDSYFHLDVFPNLFVASSEGLAFYVGQLLPRGPEETDLRIRYFEAAVELSPKHRARQDQLNADNNVNGIAILDEDRTILENIQKGVRMSSKPGVVARDEARVVGFLNNYRQLMEIA